MCSFISEHAGNLGCFSFQLSVIVERCPASLRESENAAGNVHWLRSEHAAWLKSYENWSCFKQKEDRNLEA